MHASRGEATHRVDVATSLMADFAERTGVTSTARPRRYLWTDALAVENDLALAAWTGSAHLRDRALALVEQVHRVLGHHRGDDGREGPLGSPTHPTRGGLRIGKKLPERRVDEPFDPVLEWDRDGQYFHYATRWMRALAAAARATGREELLVWARELAEVQHRAFAYDAPGRRAMFWKMSIDLRRPLVVSMGQHDALDGFVTCSVLQRERGDHGPSLAGAIADFATMIHLDAVASDDPLAIGALLRDAVDLGAMSPPPSSPARMALELVEAALDGLATYAESGALVAPVHRRLAFRELGLAIGLHRSHAIEGLEGPSDHVRRALDALGRYRPLASAIERFWLSPAARAAMATSEHRDIDEMTLAASLLAGL